MCFELQKRKSIMLIAVLFTIAKRWSEEKVIQSCPTLCDPMDYTVRGILQARILLWATFPFSRRSSQSSDQTQVSHTAGRFFTSWATREAQEPGETYPSLSALPEETDGRKGPLLVPKLQFLVESIWRKEVHSGRFIGHHNCRLKKDVQLESCEPRGESSPSVHWWEWTSKMWYITYMCALSVTPVMSNSLWFLTIWATREAPPEARSLKARCWQGPALSWDSGRKPFASLLPLAVANKPWSSCLQLQHSNLCLVFTRPSPLHVCVSLHPNVSFLSVYFTFVVVVFWFGHTAGLGGCYFLNQALNVGLWPRKCRILTTGPLGNSPNVFFIIRTPDTVWGPS